MQFSKFVWFIIVKRLHLDLTLKQSAQDLEAEMFGSEMKREIWERNDMFGVTILKCLRFNFGLEAKIACVLKRFETW